MLSIPWNIPDVNPKVDKEEEFITSMEPELPGVGDDNKSCPSPSTAAKANPKAMLISSAT